MNQLLTDPFILVLAVFVAGGLGSVIRYVFQQSRPYGLIVVNIVGTVLLGIVAGWGGISTHPGLILIIGTGLCGGMTTFSTVAVEWASYAERKSWKRLGWALRRHLFGSVVGAAAGLMIGAQLPY